MKTATRETYSPAQRQRFEQQEHQNTLLGRMRGRNARRAAAGVLPKDQPVTRELITERLGILTEHTDLQGLLAEDSGALLLDVADESGANGARTFMVRVSEVDPPEGQREADVAALNALLSLALAHGLQGGDPAEYLLNAGVTL